MTQEIDAKLVAKIKALLETKGCTEAEAQARVAKAQELLEKYNLDMAVLGQSGKGAQRSDTKNSGGLYSWQRKLWQAVAELNFCYYFSLRGLKKGSQYEHRLVGSHGNVVATEMMATYLQETVERLAQQWAKDNYYKSVFVREAIAYREGMAARISERLAERRRQVVEEIKERQREEEAKKANARANVDPGSRALTIMDVISTEHDLNNDYLQGWDPGTTAANRKAQEARMAELRAKWAEDARKQKEWDEAHPEEAAARKRAEAEALRKLVAESERKQRRRNRTPPQPRYRKPTAEEERMGLGSYYEGRAQGDKVSIDTQVNDKSHKARIR